ncbi:Glycosyltransferase [Heracleum sosnowskyi]|uniref:Glycosyltransferase n=1 Tax=Heracleum sosnowskyi TaxID=360622 RepID=A0AAD8N2I0_9APIA|nr:Glycosyltransferase [Heracleum sosnowskyi]
MMRVELIFIPAPEVGHLVAAVELAKLLVCHDERISISILIQKMPYDTGTAEFIQNLKKDDPDRIDFVDIPAPDETTMAELMSLPRTSFLEAFVSNQRTPVRDIVATVLKRSETCKLGGFVLDMFASPMIQVAIDFNVPAYVFFTSGASFLNLMFYAQDLKDNKNLEISKYKDSDFELSIPGFSNLVPAKVLPSVMLDEGGSAMMTTIARRLRKTKAIFVNTVLELEAHAIKSLEDDGNIPTIYHVGPLINSEKGELTSQNKKSNEAIMSWLDSQPSLSVVFLCFGSKGSFDIEQVKEIARALELSGQCFLWSLRRPSQNKEKMELPKDYEDYDEVLPEGFLGRTSGIGKVIGWAPQKRPNTRLSSKDESAFVVGPIINFTTGGITADEKNTEEDIVCWLDCQPPLSVLYLCFGSTGSFDTEQVTEIAHALELSKHHILWSLRRPSQEKEKLKPPTDYEDHNEVLPEGFLERTSGLGKVIGWAPQTNAFQLVKELGIAVEIKMDYRKDHYTNLKSTEVLTADAIETGIRCLMDGESEIRSTMKEMKDKCREATGEAGSSYTCIGQLINAIMDNIQEGAFN